MPDQTPSLPGEAATRRRAVRRRWLVAIGLIASGVVAAGIWFSSDFTPTAMLLREAQLDLARKKYPQAEHSARRVLARSPHEGAALLVAAEAAAELGRFDDALGYCDRIVDDGGAEAVNAHCFAGTLLLTKLHRAAEAEKRFRRAVTSDPHSVLANERLSYVLGLAGRHWEATPYRLELIRQDQFAPAHLMLMALGETALENDDVLRENFALAPDDPQILLGVACHALHNNETKAARGWLEKVIAVAPELHEAQARLGEILAREGDAAEFLAWHARLPVDADQNPKIWVVRGRWAQRQNEPQVAIRCYWEALRRDSSRQAASYELAQLLIAAGRSADAAPFLAHAKRLQDLIVTMKEYAIASRDLGIISRAARATESLGRLWEAWGWNRVILRYDPQETHALAELARLGEKLRPDRPQELASSNPAMSADFTSDPLPRWQRVNGGGTTGKAPGGVTATESAGGRAAVTFEDQAKGAGVEFQYFNSADPRRGARIFEFTGGGVAVLDFDGDGWSDLYFTQGCAWPPQADQRTHLDKLFRNMGDGHFQEVAAQAGIFENGYSQGVTVGDIDNDGFPDLYVANIGRNRLFRNNGDGTFSDITDETGAGGDRWTTSCLIADLNGDSLPDIYAVNYLTGPGLFEKICREETGATRLCTPHEFPAAQDQFHLNLGDGRFEERTDAAGFKVPNGKGLGIVAADFDGSGRLSLFVANDAVANFYFVNETASRGADPVFVERGLVTGLAYDLHGQAQACMGVAAGDANGDGLLDLFVTNFHNESNTLYQQQPGNLFADVTREANLRDASYAMLGFGTQFIDGELDGLPDLVLANGHVGDLRQQGVPYQMRPQYFRNVGHGRFEELPAESLGAYFRGQYLGRGLARVDWNRDGREDFAVSHLDAPAALVTNQTRRTGHFLAVQLRGVVSDRDAIGTTVTVTAAGRTWVSQLTAGDGYEASNQRQLIFGLGPADHVDELTIRWPSGTKQSFANLPVDAELLFIEGHAAPVRLALP